MTNRAAAIVPLKVHDVEQISDSPERQACSSRG